MPLLATVILASLPLEDDDLLVLAMADDFARDRRTAHSRIADLQIVAISRNENIVEGDLVAGLRIQRRDPDRLTGFGAELLPAGTNNRVHDFQCKNLGYRPLNMAGEGFLVNPPRAKRSRGRRLRRSRALNSAGKRRGQPLARRHRPNRYQDSDQAGQGRRDRKQEGGPPLLKITVLDVGHLVQGDRLSLPVFVDFDNRVAANQRLAEIHMPGVRHRYPDRPGLRAKLIQALGGRAGCVDVPETPCQHDSEQERRSNPHYHQPSAYFVVTSASAGPARIRNSS